MRECIDSLRKAAVFSTLDANSKYWRVETDEKDHNKTDFTSHHRLHQFIRILFGLRKTPATFQRTMNIILLSVN